MNDALGLKEILRILKPFEKAKPFVFFRDLIFFGGSAWIPLFLLSTQKWSVLSPLLFLISYVGFYGGTAFIHEVAHFAARIPGLELSYNLLFGFPNRIPAYIHKPHRFHHMPTTFGTKLDPEYLYLKGKGSGYFFRPLLAGLISPFILLIRFGVLPPILLFSPLSVRTWVYQRFSTLVVNPSYVRPLHSKNELHRALIQDMGCFTASLIFLALYVFQQLNAQFLMWWYLLASLSTMVNMYRARVAHLYDNKGEILSPLSALKDFVTIEGGPWSFLWAPIGLRFHAVHHLVPQIPYHNLKAAHSCLKLTLEAHHPYHTQTLPHLYGGLRQYHRTLKTR